MQLELKPHYETECPLGQIVSYEDFKKTRNGYIWQNSPVSKRPRFRVNAVIVLDWERRFVRMENVRWIKDNMTGPIMATTIYCPMDVWGNVFFSNVGDAIVFRLRWLD